MKAMAKDQKSQYHSYLVESISDSHISSTCFGSLYSLTSTRIVSIYCCNAHGARESTATVVVSDMASFFAYNHRDCSIVAYT